MARTSAKATEETVPSEPVTETITYVPGEGDPTSVKWCGIVFQANVPKEITGHAGGTDHEQLRYQLIESARANKHFHVGAGRPKRVANSAPKTPVEYRQHMVAWLQDPAIDHAEALIMRMAKERDLREACEVGTDDYAYLSTLFMPKLHELAKADDLTPGQVASLWVSHGFNEMPW